MGMQHSRDQDASCAPQLEQQHFVINNGPWLPVPILVGSATLVVSKHVYV
jgi:hypothetical protein